MVEQSQSSSHCRPDHSIDFLWFDLIQVANPILVYAETFPNSDSYEGNEYFSSRAARELDGCMKRVSFDYFAIYFISIGFEVDWFIFVDRVIGSFIVYTGTGTPSQRSFNQSTLCSTWAKNSFFVPIPCRTLKKSKMKNRINCNFIWIVCVCALWRLNTPYLCVFRLVSAPKHLRRVYYYYLHRTQLDASVSATE